MGIVATDNILISQINLNKSGGVRSTDTEDGGWIVTWIDRQNRLITQHFDANDVQVGENIVVAENVNYKSSMYSAASETPGGGWVQSFTRQETIDGKKIDYFHVVQFDAGGQQISDFSIEYDDNPEVALLSNGGFIVIQRNITENAIHVAATIFDAEGHQIVNKTIGDIEYYWDEIDTDYKDGKWSSKFFVADGQYRTILFDSNGNVLKSVDQTANESVKFDDDGAYVISRTIYDTSVGQVHKIYDHYSVDGTLINSVEPPPYHYGTYYGHDSVFELSNGNQVVTWTGAEGNKSGTLQVRILDSEGNLLAADVTIGEANIYQDAASVLELSTGGWVVFWRHYQQVFNADGSKHGEPIYSNFLSYGDVPDVKATDDGGWIFTFTSNGNADNPQGLYYRIFHANDINNPPNAFDASIVFDEDTVWQFRPSDMRGHDFDGDTFEKIVIEDLPKTGLLSFDGIEVQVGDTISIADVKKLHWTPPLNKNGNNLDSFHFNIIDEHGVTSLSSGIFTFNALEVNDAPEGGDRVINVLEDEKYKLHRDDFPFFDLDDNDLLSVALTTIENHGTLVVNGLPIAKRGSINFRYDHSGPYFLANPNEFGKNYATFTTRVTDSGGTDKKGHDTEVGRHTLTINVLPVNDAPKGENVAHWINPTGRFDFNDQYFHIRDVENDTFKSIIIDSLPEFGRLMIGSHRVRVGDELSVNDTKDMSFVISKNETTSARADFGFSVRDDGGTKNGGVDIDTTSNNFRFRLSSTSNVIEGTETKDKLVGTAEADIIYGEAGNDLISGGLGNDKLYGGQGSDVFQIKLLGVDDEICDFDIDNDKIDFRGSPFTSFRLLKNSQYDAGPDLVFNHVYLYHGKWHVDSLRLQDVDFNELTTDNFIF